MYLFSTPVASGRYELTVGNRDYLIGSVLGALTGAVISTAPDSKLSDMRIIWSLIKNRPLKGDGYVKILSDEDFEKQSYHPRKRKRCNLILVKTEKNCFFVAAYLQHRFNDCQTRRARCISQMVLAGREERRKLKEELRGISINLLQLAEESGERQLTRSREFYQPLGLDMDRQEVGTLETLKKLHKITGGSQISIYDQTVQYRRVLMYPNVFAPELVQINLVKIAYPKLDPGKSRGRENRYHYHSSGKIHSLLAGQGWVIELSSR